jgi:DnaK suppressor protein
MAMEELSDAEIAELQAALVELRTGLTELLHVMHEGTKPVGLDQPIGRLTRMDAMQQQSMTSAGRRDADIRLKQVEQALVAVERGLYGLCRRCDEPIGYKRLSARPESPYCLGCQEAIDRKHGR